jgi:hypothetical protein
MGLITNLRAQTRVLGGQRYRRLPDVVRLLARRPGIAFGVGAFETGLMVSGHVEGRLKELAAIKTSALVGCPF